jgi:drug/metabolite transporter, DME family
MLLGTIVLWALNLTVTRYILTHGVQPLAYATSRYGLAAITFVTLALATERTLRVAAAHLPLAVVAGLLLYVNQIGFTYAVKTTSASIIALILASVPIFAAVIGVLLRIETLSLRFWAGTGLSIAGVGLVVLSVAGEIRGDVIGILLGLMTAATWAAYSVAIAPLMQRYSPVRISAVVLPIGWVPMALTGWPQVHSQNWNLTPAVWSLLVFATLGPLVLTNLLWFRTIQQIGPSQATLAANLQPFVAALFAVVLLSERLTAVQVVGGVLIALGIVVARRRRLSNVPAE